MAQLDSVGNAGTMEEKLARMKMDVVQLAMGLILEKVSWNCNVREDKSYR